MSGVAAQLSNVQPDDPVVLIISFFFVLSDFEWKCRFCVCVCLPLGFFLFDYER
jgi:hypothetical protein